MNNVHLVHQRRTPPTKLTFDILLSTPTFHILDPGPRWAWSAGCSGNTGLPQDKRRQQTLSVSFINMVITMMIVLFDVRCINIAA